MQYAIDKPMAAEPGKVWNYSSGVTELLAYIFQKETGHDIDDYGQKYVFAPLGSGTNGSARIWESWTPKADCI
jgi:CubicO group peptidase (beta-lactamase class C family)